MRTSTWIFTAALLVSLSAAAQEPVEAQQPAPASHTQITPGPEISKVAPPAAQVSSAPQVSPAAQPSSAPQVSPAAQESSAPQAPLQASAPAPAPSAQSQPTTMNEVVDRFIEREHLLIKALATRTPVVETYLQNLSADQKN